MRWLDSITDSVDMNLSKTPGDGEWQDLATEQQPAISGNKPRNQSQTTVFPIHSRAVSVQFSRSVVSNSLRPHGLQHASLPCPSPSPRVCSYSCPSSWWCHPAISSSVVPSPTFSLSQHQGLFQWVSSSHQVAKVLELQLQHQSFQWIFSVVFL